MKLYYRQDTGDVLYAVYDKDLFSFSHSTNLPLDTYDIDEVGDGNKLVCKDLFRESSRINSAGENKYYVADGDLYSRDGWQRQIPER